MPKGLYATRRTSDDLAHLGDLEGRNDLRAGDRHVSVTSLAPSRGGALAATALPAGEISEAAFTNEVDSAYKANLVEYR